MDFKKLTTGAGTLFSRAKQFTEEKLGQAEKTEYDEEFKKNLDQAEKIKTWTEKIMKQTESYLQPNPTVRAQNNIQERLQGYKATRILETDLLGQTLVEAGNDLSSAAPAYGDALVKCGEAHQKIGAANREMMQTAVDNFLHPLQVFLDGDMKNLQKEKSTLETKRLDLDAVKSQLKRAKPPGTEQVEAELKTSQADFDKQFDLTKKLLDTVLAAHVQHLRLLQDFVEAQVKFYGDAHQSMSDLQKNLSSR